MALKLFVTSYAKYFGDYGFVIYSIGVGSSLNSSKLEGMANCTGGRYYASPSPDDLQDIYDEIFDQVLLSTVPHNIDVEVVMASGIAASTTTNFTSVDAGGGLAGNDADVLFNITATSNATGPGLPVIDLT